jgi:hypothetical protein
MKIQQIIGFAFAATSLVLAVSESTASAKLPTFCPSTLTAPAECIGRNATSYLAGVGQGVSTVDQIWESDSVNQDPDNWEILVDHVTDTIPTTVATVYELAWNQYLKCRTQGLLEGAVCRMNELDPIPGCQMDGVDWGKMSSAIYCQLSMALGGLGDDPPWFIRTPPGMCGTGFQTYCEDVFRWGATAGAGTDPATNPLLDPLGDGVLAFLSSRGVNPESLKQAPGCAAYTVSPWDGVYEDAIYVDCSYTIPY